MGNSTFYRHRYGFLFPIKNIFFFIPIFEIFEFYISERFCHILEGFGQV